MRRRFLLAFLGVLSGLGSLTLCSARTQTPHDRDIAALATLERLGTEGWVVSGHELESTCAMLRHGDPTPFEREWMLAAAALLGRSACFHVNDAVREHLDHALSRFPDDAQLQLARVLMRPEGFTASNRPGVSRDSLAHSRGLGIVSLGGVPINAPPSPYAPNPRTIPQSIRDLERLSQNPDVGDDARAHLALLRFVFGDVPAGLADAQAVSSRADPFIQNLAGLVGGLALDVLGRPPEATESYRKAVQALPQALGTATALAAHSFLADHRAEAATVLGRAYASDASTANPWPCPVTNDVLPQRLARLRAMLNLPDVAPSSKNDTQGLPPSPARDIATATPIPPTSVPASPAATGQGQPVFRVTSTGVNVDVAVRIGKTPVLGLMPADFEVRDNGVPQAVRALSVSAVPLDVSIVLDTTEAATVAAPGTTPWAQVEPDVRQIAALLRPADHLRVLAANVRPREVLAMGDTARLLPQTLDFHAPFEHFAGGSGTTALYDTVAAALMEPVAPDRRSLVVVFTDGIDGLSVLTSNLLIAVASESEALMHVARHDTDVERLRARNPRAINSDAQERLWPPDLDVIENAARATGGAARHVADTESSVNIFKQILDEFRQSYVLQYQPTGVTPGGWHQITVRVTRPGKYDVHARRGYFGG